MAEQQNLLQVFIEEVLKQNGFGDLSEAARQELLPQYVVEAERRLGLALMPYLDEVAAKELTELAAQADTSPQKLWNFWQSHVPNFDQVIKTELNKFAEEMKLALKAARS